MSSVEQTDVVIVGGGLSGLYLAYRLQQQGIDFRLLEANPRLGGRILSQPVVEGSALSVDLGPTWFWPHQPLMRQLVDELVVPYFEQYVTGEALYQLQPNVKPQRVQGGDPMLSYRIQNGMGSLIAALCAVIDPQRIALSQPVNIIKKEGEGWLVYSSNNNVHSNNKHLLAARHLIFAVPPRVLLETVPLETWLPNGLLAAMKATPTWMAAQAKCVATYQEPFWRNAGLSGDVFSRVGPMVEIHDASAEVDNGYALFGFLGIPYAQRQQHGETVMVQHCLRQLVDIFGESARQPLTIYFQDWARDPRVTTTRDINGSHAHPFIDLSPYEDELTSLRMGFAGTEFAPTEAGYLEGALVAANAALNNLSPLS